MGTYQIPRNYKGETRLLVIFTIKSLITTLVGAAIGGIFLLIFTIIGLKKIGFIIFAIFALLGYVSGAFKIPTIVGFPVTKKIGGESIYEIVLRYIRFNRNRKIYVNTKEE